MGTGTILIVQLSAILHSYTLQNQHQIQTENIPSPQKVPLHLLPLQNTPKDNCFLLNFIETKRLFTGKPYLCLDSSLTPYAMRPSMLLCVSFFVLYFLI